MGNATSGLGELHPHRTAVQGLGWSSSGRYLCCVLHNCEAHVWDGSKGSHISFRTRELAEPDPYDWGTLEVVPVFWTGV
jgi:hypothetical protein